MKIWANTEVDHQISGRSGSELRGIDLSPGKKPLLMSKSSDGMDVCLRDLTHAGARPPAVLAHSSFASRCCSPNFRGLRSACPIGDVDEEVALMDARSRGEERVGGYL